MKYIPLENVVEIYNRIDSFVPKNKELRTARCSMLNVLNEVLSYSVEVDKENIFREIEHAYRLEDARNFVADYLAWKHDCDTDDITDEELDGYDYEYLVEQYEDRQDCNVAFNDTWQAVVEDYFEDMDN